jgi:hypothetical protein
MLCPGHFIPQNDPVPIVQEAGWLQNILPSPWFEPWTVQPVASHYTNSAVPADSTLIIYLILITCICMLGNVIFVMFLGHNHLEKILIYSVIELVDWLVLGHVSDSSVQTFLSLLVGLAAIVLCYQQMAALCSCAYFSDQQLHFIYYTPQNIWELGMQQHGLPI